MYFVYAIYNSEVDKLYVGQSENVGRRLREHNDKIFRGSWTSRFSGKWVLVYKEEFSNRPLAMRREKALKSYRGREFLKKLI